MIDGGAVLTVSQTLFAVPAQPNMSTSFAASIADVASK